MDKLQAMRMFVRVVEMNSFARASESFDLPATAATRMINGLETYLQVRLLQRTTRRLNLTAEGAQYYERCVRILSEIDEADEAMTKKGRGPSGTLRIDMPSAIGKSIVIPKIEEFNARYSELNVLIGLGDKPIDLIHDGVDCAIRTGYLEGSSLVARRLSTLETVTAASPAYLEKFGEPTDPSELDKHIAVHYFSGDTGKILDMHFLVDEQPIAMKLRGQVGINDVDAYVTCGVHGSGLIQLPKFIAHQYLESGELVEVLREWKPPGIPISVVYPNGRHLALKVRTFVDWIADVVDDCPLLAGASKVPVPPAPMPPIKGATRAQAKELTEIVI